MLSTDMVSTDMVSIEQIVLVSTSVASDLFSSDITGSSFSETIQYISDSLALRWDSGTLAKKNVKHC